MDSNLIVLTDQDGNSVRFELLDIVEYKEDEYAVLYPADGGDDEPVHILRIISENLDVNEAELTPFIRSSASATIWTTDSATQKEQLFNRTRRCKTLLFSYFIF